MEYNTNNGYVPQVQPKSKLVTLLLCYFLGGWGIHRFYNGKVGTGILWLLTAGLCGVGTVIDFIVILCNGFKSKNGMPLRNDLPTWVIVLLLILWVVLVGILALSGVFLTVIGGLFAGLVG